MSVLSGGRSRARLCWVGGPQRTRPTVVPFLQQEIMTVSNVGGTCISKTFCSETNHYCRSHQIIEMLLKIIWTKYLDPHAKIALEDVSLISWTTCRMFLFDFHKSESDYISFIVSFVVIIPQEKKSQDSTCISLPFISVTKPGWSCFPSPWGTIVWVIQEATHLNSITHEPKIYFVLILLPSEQNATIQSIYG